VRPRKPDISWYYTVLNPQTSSGPDWRAFYEHCDDLTDAVRQTVRHELDVPFGPHPRQIMDLYFPESAATDAPVLLFLHGGGFREGDPAHYGFVARLFVERGAIVASAGYRLFPETFFPESAADVEAAIGWLYRNIGERAGSAQRITIAGHSAGAMQAAYVSVRSEWRTNAGLPDDVIKGAVLISGRYDFSGGQFAFLDSHTDGASVSPVRLVDDPPARTLVAYGTREGEIDERRSSGEAIVDAIVRTGRSAELMVLPLDHAETVLALADSGSPLFQAAAGIVFSG
jgi:arylformamidase